MLKLDAVGRQFGSLWAVRDVSFTVEPSEIVGIIGPNGAGKSTLFNLIAGAVVPTAGVIRFLDRTIDYGKPYQVARRGLARTFQIPKPFKQLTVRENVMLSALRRHHTPRQANTVATATMEFIRIIELAEASVASLTVGQLKKLELARALAAEPVLLLLDEVMAGLTPPEIKEMMTVIGSLPKRGVTVAWVEHVMMAMMNVAERIVVMHQGQIIAQGTPADVSKNPAVIVAYLGEKDAYAARSQVGCFLRPHSGLARDQRARGRTGDCRARWRQRRRQNDDLAKHHGPQGPHRRRNLAERRAHRPIASVRASSAGDRPDPRTTAAVSVYDRYRKLRARSLSARAARGAQRQPGNGFRSAARSCRAPPPDRGFAQRRRAADVRHRPCADESPATPHARRTDGRPRTPLCRAPIRSDRAPSGRRHHHYSRRTEC